ncbi:hypothetical protein OG455_32055 [Kitasatospora sp. NBC_01287]|uniref:hypothetical protein n=1 Tax=Kitasatospora sp. NBC_01287 TaxID=2903573 RepID=UPI0022525BF1|nr:hypothetical protein [Kitasatospora sp. NBC_01287]MCX4750097.1 hypothetical protein [Kitasatospora sp. NBC_01287]
MRTFSKALGLRRTIAMAAAGVSLAAGVTFLGAGAAHADAQLCGAVNQGGADGSPWNHWELTPCIVEANDGGFYTRTYLTGGSTDVRVYSGVYDSCNGVTYGVNGDSDANHFFQGQSGWFTTGEVYGLHCSNGLWAISRVFSNGNGSPWAWSNGIGAQ